MAKKSIRDLELKGRTVLVRADFNVPQDEDLNITDDTRIRAALPTIEHLIERGARTVLASHLGRPKGERNEKFSLAPVARRLAELLLKEVKFVGDCIGDDVAAAAAAMADGDVILLENVRFYKEETANDPAFAEKLAAVADVFVNDAFGTAHRAHASTSGVAAHVSECAMGFLMERELRYLQGELAAPAKPFVVILGGKKVSDKIGVIYSLMDKADCLLVGGAMQYAFRKAQGYAIGNSYVDDDDVPVAADLLEKVAERGVKLLLPADSIEADGFSNDANTNNIRPYDEGGSIRDGWEGLDIGARAIEEFCAVIGDARTVVWNGPMGVFEIDAFAKGTRAVAEAVAASGATSIIGGGDSVTAIKKFGLEDQVTFISTGGGASLELLEGKDLPGVVALDDA